MSTHRWTPYLFLAPFAAVFLTFLVYPLIQSVFLATQQTFGPGFVEQVGFDNFRLLLQDPRFHKAFLNTCLFAAGNLLLQMPLALGLALLMNQPWLKGRAFYRVIVFSPALIGTVFVGVLFGVIFQKRVGLLNQILHGFFPVWDLEFPWLEEFILPAMILASLWMWIGYNMIYFLAALQNVDRDLLEASRIDGANARQRFWHVILPAIRPVAGFVVLISMIGSFQVFELPYLMLGNTSGPDDGGLTIVMYLFENGFQIGDLGYASAIGWVLAVVLVFLSLIQRRLSRGEAYA